MANFNELYDLVLEAYYGKSNTISQIEDVIGEILDILEHDNLVNLKKNPLTSKLESLISQQFGFKQVHIIWNRNIECMINVSTIISMDTAFRGNSKYIIDSKNGYYDKSNSHVAYINLSASIPKQFGINKGEYTAILLHEIGHNFDTSIYGTITYLTFLVKCAIDAITLPKNMSLDASAAQINSVRQRRLIDSAGKVLMTTGPVKDSLNTINVIIEWTLDHIPFYRKISDICIQIGSALVRWLGLLVSPLAILSVPVYVLLSPVYHLQGAISRKSEAFSDSFATAYGYGPQLASGLSKISAAGVLNKNSKINNQGVVKVLTDLAMLSVTIMDVFATGSNHGSIGTRITTTIELIKRELNTNDLTPEVKVELRNQLKSLEKIYQNYLDAVYNGTQLPMTAAVRHLVDEAFGGRADFIAKFLPDFYAGDGLKVESVCDDANLDLEILIYESAVNGSITNTDRDELIDMLRK